MKKLFLLSALSICLVFCLFATSCSRKGFATAPPDYGNDTQYVPFTKVLKQRLEHDGVDIKRIQFYVDQKLVLKHGAGAEKGTVKSGIILLDYSQPGGQIVIPEFTPGVCEKVNGDELFISFDAPGKTLDFGALYANNTFMLVGTNWHNGTVDITYDGQPYIAECSACGNVAEAKLFVRKNQAYSKDENSKIVIGRKVN